MSPAAAVRADLLRDILPADRVVTGEDTADWRVAGRAPRAVAFPNGPEEVAAILALARSERWAVEPAGDGRWLSAGNPGRPVDLLVSTARMDRIVEYEPGDLTLTGGAGLPLRTLARRAREERQWLAADPPGVGGTLGALAATGVAGPLQAGYGGPRDLVLGLEMVDGHGRHLKLGGRVVKNVAGFDLVRLVVGSRGTLGVVTQVTVRLHPVPDQDRTWVLEAGRAEDLLAPARRIATSEVVPAALEVTERRNAGGEVTARLAVRLLGSEARVAAEAEALEKAAGRPLSALARDAADELWDEMREMEEDADLVLRMSMPPTDAPHLMDVARALGRVRGGRDTLERTPVRMALHVTQGVLRLVVPNVRTDSGWDDDWGQRLGDVRRTLEARGGSLVVASAPRLVVERAGAWGDPGPAARLMRDIKARFDPGGILAPGRFVVPDEGGAAETGGADDAVPSANEDT